jgi:peptide-methionine (S)-S-oxide reductase
MTTEQATLGGGCYWCLDALYRRIRGVTKVESGYSGGHSDNPTTAQVYEGHTGHAEVVQLSFDPTVITYRELLEIFFVMHDPTTLNRQGYDVGDEYRSIILFQSNEQQSIAEDMIQTFATTVWNAPIVTQLVPFAALYRSLTACRSLSGILTSDYYVTYCRNRRKINRHQTFVCGSEVARRTR